MRSNQRVVRRWSSLLGAIEYLVAAVRPEGDKSRKEKCLSRFFTGWRPVSTADAVLYSAETSPVLLSSLKGKAHAAQQGLEMEIGSQGVHPGIHPGPNQSIRPFAFRLFQPLQSSIWLD